MAPICEIHGRELRSALGTHPGKREQGATVGKQALSPIWLFGVLLWHMMIAPEKMCRADKPDAELVTGSLAGDRSAFNQIVARYQTLVAALTYSATGSVSRSEDLAQEVFIRAWRELPQLREPAKLRPWLCSIARFMISKARRKDSREPVNSAETLDGAPEPVAIEPVPSEGAINREEEMILWRSLGKLPELYREPLVLFYREHQSIQSVAAALDLTEDAVKQRLSRGRKLLHEEVLLFVESALERTNPGPALGFAVMAAVGIGAPSAKAASIGAVSLSSKASAAGKGLSLFSGAAVTVAFVAAIGGQVAAFWGRARSGRSPRERRFLAQTTLGFLGWKLLLLIGLLGLMFISGGNLTINTFSDALPWAALWVGLLGIWVAYSIWMGRQHKAIRLAEGPSHAEDGETPGSVVDRAALRARVYGGLAAWIFGPGGLLIFVTHSKGNSIVSGALLSLAIAAWLVSTRSCLRRPEAIGRVVSFVWCGQAVVALAVVNLLWGSWAGLEDGVHFAPMIVNFLILLFYLPIGIVLWMQERFTRVD